MGAGVALSLAGFAEKRAAVWLPVLLLAGFALARAVSRDNVSLYGLAADAVNGVLAAAAEPDHFNDRGFGVNGGMLDGGCGHCQVHFSPLG